VLKPAGVSGVCAKSKPQIPRHNSVGAFSFQTTSCGGQKTPWAPSGRGRVWLVLPAF
jgi:hypothetical protein